ncbi:MAG: hypothetical protein WBE26_02190 [Phycisphaerae bacterium]
MHAAKGATPKSHFQRWWIPALVALLAVGGLCIPLARSQGHWYLAFVGLIPLFASIRFLAPTAAMAAGAFWGLCVSVSLALFGDITASHILAHLGALTAIPAVYAYFGAQLTRQVGFSPYLLGLGWMGVELALSALGLRNGLLAPTLGDGLVIHWVGNFAGAVLVAFLVVYVNALLFTAVRVVYVSASQRRYATTSSDGVRRLHPREPFREVFAFIRQANPRAPPLLVWIIQGERKA